MASRGLLLMISPVAARHTKPSTEERSAPQAFASSQSRTVYSYSRTATASRAADMASVSFGSDDTCRPTISTCSDGFAATRDSMTLTSLRMLGVEVSQTTASIFFARIRSMTACTVQPGSGSIDQIHVMSVLDRHSGGVSQPLGVIESSTLGNCGTALLARKTRVKGGFKNKYTHRF
jgi:hypothetical protein